MTAPIAATGPNAEQIEYWNSSRAESWVELADRLDAAIEPFGALGIERLELAAGERVSAGGCGGAATTRALAQPVGAGGSARGVEVSWVRLARARERAGSAGFANVEFANADAFANANTADELQQLQRHD